MDCDSLGEASVDEVGRGGKVGGGCKAAEEAEVGLLDIFDHGEGGVADKVFVRIERTVFRGVVGAVEGKNILGQYFDFAGEGAIIVLKEDCVEGG